MEDHFFGHVPNMLHSTKMVSQTNPNQGIFVWCPKTKGPCLSVFPAIHSTRQPHWECWVLVSEAEHWALLKSLGTWSVRQNSEHSSSPWGLWPGWTLALHMMTLSMYRLLNCSCSTKYFHWCIKFTQICLLFVWRRVSYSDRVTRSAL